MATTTIFLRRVTLSSVSKPVLTQSRGLSAFLSPLYESAGLPDTQPKSKNVSQPSVTRLENGVTVVSESSSMVSTITMTYPKAGSNNESVEEFGASIANRFMSYKSASGLSSFLIFKTFQRSAAIPSFSGGRTSTTLGYTTCREKALDLIPLLATNSAFEDWDVRDALKDVAKEITIAHDATHVVLTEQLFAAAYGPQSAMGRPYFNSNASVSAMKSFRAKAYGIHGAVLAATGIDDHASFCAHVEASLSESPPGESTEVPTPVYLGGESRLFVPSVPVPHIALAFPAPSNPVMTHILKECFQVQGSSPFYIDGLIGVYGSDVDALSKILATKPSADTIRRAKALAKAKETISVEGAGSVALAKSMTDQVLATGATITSASFDAVTAQDVSAAYDAMLKAPLTMASIGNISMVPYHGSVASRFS